MTECGHLKVTLLACVYHMEKKIYEITKYEYCNECAIKMGDMVQYKKKEIPDFGFEGTVKVICNVRTNGREYRWFGHSEDRGFMEEHGDKWE